MNFRILIVLFSVFFVSLANAVPVSNLYRADIKLPVVGSDDQLLDEAFSQAVEQVLVRVSGDKKAISGDLLKQAQSDAPTWVAQHSVVSLPQLLPVNGELVAGKKVSVIFYRESIDRFLSKNNLPVWGNNRPSVLVWAVSEDNGVRSISGANAPSELLNDLATSAAMVGVPIYAPLVDSVDKSAISPSDIWGFFESSIKQASKRYQTDAVAAMRVTDYAGTVSGTLLVLLDDGTSQRFSLNGDSLQALADQASSDMALVLSTRYAAVRNVAVESRLMIQVSGINSYLALNKVQSYLEQVGVVRDVFVVGAKGDLVTFSVAINGSKQKLINSISLSSLLQVDNTKPIATKSNGVAGEPMVGESVNQVDVPAEPIETFKYSGVQQ